ncbi:MAG: orotate phosphoribosyltransferase [Clostridia bacterium]|nr:orotate phosphoribosyltransferase [Clostridia bacterium]
MLSKQEIEQIFKDTGVMLEGHFLLTSGRHSDKYMQCARLFEYPKYSEMLSKQVAEMFADTEIDLVVGPAIGGIIMAYEVARQIGVKNVFAERQEGVMTLRRNFVIPQGARVLVTEDVVTTGGSVREVMALVEKAGATVVGVGSMVDRSNGAVDFGVPFKPVYRTEVISYEQENCPLCKEGKLPAIKPGSRK